MSKPVGELAIEPEPSPRGEMINYAQLLRHDVLLRPDVVSTRITLPNMANLHLFKEDDNYSIEADVADYVSAGYRSLSLDRRTSLEFKVKVGMARSARLLVGDMMTHEQLFEETSAVMNHQPLLFEPYESAMLMGRWKPRQQLHFEASDISSPEQRLILLGGFAAFLNFMTEEK